MASATVMTPALLFPAISLLMLAYTNRFLVLAQLVRQLAEKEQHQTQEAIRGQIANLHLRLALIRNMQIAGVVSFLLCTLSMFALFVGQMLLGEVLFGVSLLSLTASLLISLYEISISTRALDLQLRSINDHAGDAA